MSARLIGFLALLFLIITLALVVQAIAGPPTIQPIPSPVYTPGAEYQLPDTGAFNG